MIIIWSEETLSFYLEFCAISPHGKVAVTWKGMCNNRRKVFAQVLRRGPTTGFLEDDIFGLCISAKFKGNAVCLCRRKQVCKLQQTYCHLQIQIYYVIVKKKSSNFKTQNVKAICVIFHTAALMPNVSNCYFFSKFEMICRSVIIYLARGHIETWHTFVKTYKSKNSQSLNITGNYPVKT